MTCGLVHWCPSPEPATTLHDVCVDVRVCVCAYVRLGILRDHPLEAELLEELDGLEGTDVRDLMGGMNLVKPSPLGPLGKRILEPIALAMEIEDVDSPTAEAAALELSSGEDEDEDEDEVEGEGEAAVEAEAQADLPAKRPRRTPAAPAPVPAAPPRTAAQIPCQGQE